VVQGSRGDELQRSRISPFSLSCRRYRTAKVKSVAQQDLLALHKVRAQLVKSRTALCNLLRGLLRELVPGTKYEQTV
jgi:transposase